MGILDRLKSKIQKDSEIDIDNFSAEIREDEEISELDTLDLGWYYSETKDETQMAKIAAKDRATHFYIVGASGSGKSKFIEFLVRQDITRENGFGVIDPHGDLVEDVKGYLALDLPENEIEERIVLINPVDPAYTVAFNPLEKIAGLSAAEISAELVESFKKIWGAEGSSAAWGWGARMEDLLRNSFIALIEAELTLKDLPRFLTDEDVRLNVLDKVTHPIARQYFARFNTLSPKTRDEWMESTLNKVNAFLSDDRIRELFSFKKSSFSLRDIMDGRKILLLKLDRGRLKDSADLIGSLLMTKIKMAAFSRSDLPREARVPFYLYVDEFQNFATEGFIEVLSEARKYALSLVMAHQNLSQLPKELQDSILTNCGIQIYFRTSRRDAEILAKEAFETTGTEVKAVQLSEYGSYHDYFTYQEEWEHYFEELQNLPPRVCYVKHKIEGGIIPIMTDEVLPPYQEFGYDADNYLALLDTCHFGRRYLLERRSLKETKAAEEDEVTKVETVSEEAIPSEAAVAAAKKKEERRARTLEEISASLTPVEKATLYAIGIGNYYASDIFEEANKQLKKMGASTQHYNEFKKVFYDFSKLPPEGKGLVEFSKRGRSFCYWLSQWGEIAFAEKFKMPTDRAINEMGGGGKLSRAVALEVIKGWLEPEGYTVSKEDEIATDLTESHKGFTDLIAEKDGEVLRIEIEHRSTKGQIETNIRKNLEYADMVYEIASDEVAKKKVVQVALKVLFRLRKEKQDRNLSVKIATVDELKKSGFRDWFVAKT